MVTSKQKNTSVESYRRQVVALSIVFFSVVFMTGLLTVPSLGDEVYHFRFAREMFFAKSRIPYDPIFRGPLIGYFINVEPLWHFALTFFWWVTGGPTHFLAQLYQSAYSVLLLCSTYLLSKALYDEKRAFLASLLVASIPMVSVFSVLLYTDVPAAALCTLALYFFVKHKYVCTSLALAAAGLVKMSSLFFLPALCLIILKSKESSLYKKVQQLLLVAIPPVAAFLCDVWWRRVHLNVDVFIAQGRDVPNHLPSGSAITNRLMLKYWDLISESYSASSLFNLKDILAYMGVLLLCGLVLSVLSINRGSRKKEIVVIPLVIYFLLYCYMFHPAGDIRYLLPISPLLAVIASGALMKYWDKRPLKYFVIIIFLIQLMGVSVYMMQKRVIKDDFKEAFAYLKRSTPSESLVMYPEGTVIEFADRANIWANHQFREDFRALFWSQDKSTPVNYFISKGVKYLAVKKDRIYDDSERKHFGGYPKSFIQGLDESEHFLRLYDNESISIWELMSSDSELKENR